jgi:hypothetical protein
MIQILFLSYFHFMTDSSYWNTLTWRFVFGLVILSTYRPGDFDSALNTWRLRLGDLFSASYISLETWTQLFLFIAYSLATIFRHLMSIYSYLKHLSLLVIVFILHMVHLFIFHLRYIVSSFVHNSLLRQIASIRQLLFI